MKSTLSLSKVMPNNETSLKAIQVRDKKNGYELATINEAGSVCFNDSYSVFDTQLREISIMVANFDLFYNNIK